MLVPECELIRGRLGLPLLRLELPIHMSPEPSEPGISGGAFELGQIPTRTGPGRRLGRGPWLDRSASARGSRREVEGRLLERDGR
jgi:hypothetical protein